MDKLIPDIIHHICTYLPDIDIVQFLSTTQKMCYLKNIIHYNDRIVISTVTHLPYFNNFTNVIIGNFEPTGTFMQEFVSTVDPTIKINGLVSVYAMPKKCQANSIYWQR